MWQKTRESMKITLNEKEMVERWMLLRYHEVPRCDAAITRVDGIDLRGLSLIEARAWYVDLLDRGEAGYLSPEDIAAEVAVRPEADGVAVVALPENCRRVVAMRLNGREGEVELLRADDGSARRRSLGNPFSRGGRACPVAVVSADKRLTIYSLPGTEVPVIESLTCVMEPADGTFVMDDSALGLINKDNV